MKDAELLESVWIDLEKHMEEAGLLPILFIGACHFCNDPKRTKLSTCGVGLLTISHSRSAGCHPMVLFYDKFKSVGQNLEGCVAQISCLAILKKSIEAQLLPNSHTSQEPWHFSSKSI